jgi:hypothetical protein
MKTQKTDFTFQKTGHGHYYVTYQSPVTGNTWTVNTSDMEIIDSTKNEDSPKQKDLDQLKRLCKS